jgi:hypothetical protein
MHNSFLISLLKPQFLLGINKLVIIDYHLRMFLLGNSHNKLISTIEIKAKHKRNTRIYVIQQYVYIDGA